MRDIILENLLEYSEVETERDFTSLTTFRVGGKVRYVVYPNSLFNLSAVLRILNTNKVPYKVLGNGSNILPSDDYYDGAIIKLTRSLNNYQFDEDLLIAEAGCSIISLAYKALDKELSGLEFASGIPGTVGGCVFMNAGAYKASMSDLIEEVQVLKGDEFVWLKNEECQFGYRTSIFSKNPDLIITAIKMRLKKGNKEEIKNLMANRQQRRMETQPLEYPSAGSTFRNVNDGFAWKYIDEIGYRGKMVGGAMVSTKHSNFIINHKNATASDIMTLANEITVKVKEKFDVDMIMEVEKFNWNNK